MAAFSAISSGDAVKSTQAGLSCCRSSASNFSLPIPGRSILLRNKNVGT